MELIKNVFENEKYRNRGLIRQIIQEIEKDYSGKNDGYFLFANDSVLDFYPRFGFKKWDEFGYTKTFLTAQKQNSNRCL